jgi:hypothetical protein
MRRRATTYAKKVAHEIFISEPTVNFCKASLFCTRYHCREISAMLYTLFYGRGSTNSDARH